MDINLKSKDIIKKQQEKYSSKEWAEYFNVILEYKIIPKYIKKLYTSGNTR